MTQTNVDTTSAAWRKPPALRPRSSKSGQAISTDAQLRRAVLARLILDPLFHIGRVDVSVLAGVATLSGYATSNAGRDAAKVAAGGVKGVDHVVDRLLVAVPCAPQPEARRMTIAALRPTELDAVPSGSQP
jgi:hypothetical protein